MTVKQQDIKDYWNNFPVGTNFIKGSADETFFKSYDNFRYCIEGHILHELDSVDWRNKQVLEIGTGQGADSMQLVLRGARLTGVDLTEESIRRVKERFRVFGVSYEKLCVVDAQQLPFADESFDIVYTHGVIHHSPAMSRIINEANRVLKPGGQLIAMVYHKNSLNYWLNIAVVRRIGLLLMSGFKGLVPVVARRSGESTERLEKHLLNFKEQGLSYLAMRNFIHKNTDGPDNVFSSVWTKKSLKRLLKSFSGLTFKVHYLNERHLLGLQKWLPARLKNWLAQNLGWHLWVYAKK